MHMISQHLRSFGTAIDTQTSPRSVIITRLWNCRQKTTNKCGYNPIVACLAEPMNVSLTFPFGLGQQASSCGSGPGISVLLLFPGMFG